MALISGLLALSSLLRTVGAPTLAELLGDFVLDALLLVERLLSGREQPAVTQRLER